MFASWSHLPTYGPSQNELSAHVQPYNFHLYGLKKKRSTFVLNMFSVFKEAFVNLVSWKLFPLCPQQAFCCLIFCFSEKKDFKKLCCWEIESACNYVVSSTVNHTQCEVAIFHIKVPIKWSNTGNCSHDRLLYPVLLNVLYTLCLCLTWSMWASCSHS